MATYLEPTLIRALGAIEYVACHTDAGEPRVLVRARAGVALAEVAPLLAEIARVHRLIDDPAVPKVAEADGACVALACDASHDFETIIEDGLAEREDPRVPELPPFEVSEGAGASFAIYLLELLERVHRTIDPETGRPVFLGALSTANFLADERGRVWALGWGHPFRGPQRAQLFADAPAAFVAPESAFGLAPSPGSDLTAASLFLQSFHRLGEMPPAITRCLAGEAVEPALAARILALMQNSHAARPEDRSVTRFLEDFRPTVALLGIEPDAPAMARAIGAGIAIGRARRRSGGALVVATDGRWCQPPGQAAVSLERRGAMRKLVMALAAARRDTPGAPLSWEDLLHAGWPSESPRVEAAKNRVYVAIAQLRNLGLRDVLVRLDAGYMFDPAVPLAWSDGAPP